MKITINKNNLLTPLKLVFNVVESNSVNPTFNRVLLKTINQNELALIGSNSFISIKTIIKEGLTIKETGGILVNGRILYSIISKIDNPELALELIDNSVLRISTPNFSSDINIYEENSYPNINFDFSGWDKLLLPTNFIKEIIYKLSNITSPLGKDNYYPVLKGILIDGARVDAQVEAISTDGVHLIYIKTPFNGSKFKIIVNAAIFKYITDLIDLDKEIIFYVQKNNLIIQIKDFLFSCRLIEGDYPSSIKAIEETKEFKFIVDKRKFINALEKGLIVGGGEKKPSIALQINVNKLKLTSRSVEWGSSYEELDIEGYTGDNIRLLLNIKTLSNLIKNIESEKIEFRFSNNAKPIAVLDQSNPNYFSIIMPIRNN